MPFIPFEDLEVGKRYEIDRDAIPPNTGLKNLSDVIREDPEITHIKFNRKLENLGPRNDTALVFEMQDATGNIVRNEDVRTILRYRFYSSDAGRIPFKSKLPDVISDKSKVQAVKDVLAQKGVPEESSTGPLSTILGMVGIKTPPKQSGVGRRKTRKSKSKKSRKTQKH
jgi:hypothetical protein